MSLMRPGFLLTFAVLAAAPRASADPTKQECISANEAGQDQQRAGKLRAAREQLAVCVAVSCPAAIRQDCAQRLDDVARAAPSVIFAAKGASGDDLTAVRVVMDDAPLLDHLDGKAIDVDPGPHRFRFQAEGFAPKDRTVVVRMGEKDRIVEIELRPVEFAPSVVPPQPAVVPVLPPPRRTLVAPAIASFAVGIAGVIAGGVLTGLWAQAKSDGDAACGVPLSCDPATASAWQNQQVGYSIGAFVAFGVAVVGVALGVTFLVAGSPKGQARAVGFLRPGGAVVTF